MKGGGTPLVRAKQSSIEISVWSSWCLALAQRSPAWPDVRNWIPEDELAHVVVEAVERVNVSRLRANECRGTDLLC